MIRQLLVTVSWKANLSEERFSKVFEADADMRMIDAWRAIKFRLSGYENLRIENVEYDDRQSKDRLEVPPMTYG
jgi:hypothetical protein